MSLPDHIFEIKDFLVEKGFPDKIEAVVILGSGLGDFGDEILSTWLTHLTPINFWFPMPPVELTSISELVI